MFVHLRFVLVSAAGAEKTKTSLTKIFVPAGRAASVRSRRAPLAVSQSSKLLLLFVPFLILIFFRFFPLLF